MPTIRVEGVEIPERLIADEAQHHRAPDLDQARASASRALAIKALLLRRAEELGLKPEPQTDGAGREETSEEALIRAVLDLEAAPPEPTETECLRVYEAERSRFVTMELYEASHVLFEPDGGREGAWIAAEQAALEALAAVRAGARTFEATAAEVSRCPSSAQGGSLGQLRRGDLVGPVEEALLALSPGETATAPVRSKFGWHLLRLDRRLPRTGLPFEAVREVIALRLAERAWTTAAARYVQQLSRRYELAGVRLSLEPTNGDPAGTLGRLLGELKIGAEGLGAWLSKNDPELAEPVRQAALKAGVSVSDYVSGAVDDFAASADDEAWTKLMSVAQGAADPAFACVAHMTRKKLNAGRRAYTIIKKV